MQNGVSSSLKRRFIFQQFLISDYQLFTKTNLLLVVVFSFDFFSHFFGNYIAYGLVFCHTLANLG